MIKIENKKYKCNHFEHHIINGVEHLKVVITGGLDIKKSRIVLEYENQFFYGYKIFPKIKENKTSFLVYVFQEGDSEK